MEFESLKNIFQNSLTKLYNDCNNLRPLFAEIKTRRIDLGQAPKDAELIAELEYFSKLNFE